MAAISKGYPQTTGDTIYYNTNDLSNVTTVTIPATEWWELVYIKGTSILIDGQFLSAATWFPVPLKLPPGTVLAAATNTLGYIAYKHTFLARRPE